MEKAMKKKPVLGSALLLPTKELFLLVHRLIN